MFGYVMANSQELRPEQRKRYLGCYCGICRAIGARASLASRVALNYDMVFLALLLSSLYEPAEEQGSGRCLVHPLASRPWRQNEATLYAADMNVALAYFSADDHWRDDHRPDALALRRLLRPHYEAIQSRFPRQCRAIETCIQDLSRLESERCPNPDLPANCFGLLMAELFCWRDDRWSGYLRQMAMGLGRLVGYHLPRNFLDPYASVTVSEFYRRWHATLGRWFREYVYIPLGGSRKGWKRTAVNLAIVWALTGFWHGNGGNYLLWAGFLLALILLEKLFWGKVCRKVPLLGHLYTIFAILISWVPFAIGDRAKMTVFLGKLFGMGRAVNPLDYRMVGGAYLPYLIIGVLLAMPWLPRLVRKVQKYWIADVLLFLLFWVCVYVMATSVGSPFLYFQF